MTEQSGIPADGISDNNTAAWPGIVRWYVQGARCNAFRPPRWNGLQASPELVAVMAFAGVLLTLLLERTYIAGPAHFYWQALTAGWLGTAIAAWICYLLLPRPAVGSHADSAPSAVHLFCMLMAQSQTISLLTGIAYAVLIRNGGYSEEALGRWGVWAAWLAPILWGIAAQLTMLWRAGTRRPVPMLLAGLALLAATALYVVQPMEFWYPARQPDEDAQRKRLELSQEMMEAQPRLLARRLRDLQAQRPGIIDLYGLTFAPYADEDVFRRESDMVSQVMAQRFDANGRTLQLINHAETVEQWPWATPLNLQRALRHIGKVMNPAEDILFLHLTSHGARDGELAAGFWPMTVAGITPSALKGWLDKARIKYRVISISACYSGSWIDALADENTLVMTAADADHTSYGCGRRSELTFFGRAMYDEQLRDSTLDFEEAFATARNVIKQREEEAGKSDGYSNPQIKTGKAIRDRLTQLRKRLMLPDTSASAK